jgi:hypothetical protein
MAKYESQQWADEGLGLKQYHKGRTWVLNNTTKAKLYGANYGPTSQLWAKNGHGFETIPQMPNINNGPTKGQEK